MATSLTSGFASNDTDAHFRNWGSAVSAALAAVGMVQTADTGQINWSTVTAPTTAHTEGGYEIWQFPSDANQTAMPIFIRLGYGTGYSSGYPSCNVSIGEGSNGSGALTGRTAGPYEQSTSPYGSGAPAGVMKPIYASLSNGQLFLLFQWAGADVALSIVIGRTVNATGAADSRGLWHLCNQTTAGPTLVTLTELLQHGVAHVGVGAVAPSYPAITSTVIASDGSMPVSPLIYYSGDGSVHGALEKTLCLAGIGSGSAPEGSVLSITRWDGNAHSYLLLPWMYISVTGSSYCGTLILWE